jgi:hypothetical protein
MSKTQKQISSDIRAKIAAGEKKRRDELKKKNNTESKIDLHFMDIDALTEHDTQAAAHEIWCTLKPLRLTPWMAQPYDVKIDMFHKKFPKFCTTFPVVIKYMINDGIFSHKAFENYLKKLKTKSPTNKEQWAERQADYIKYCIMDIDKKPGYMKRAMSAYNDVKKGLMEDMDDMKKDMDEAKKLADADTARLALERRQDLNNKLMSNPDMRLKLEKILARKKSVDAAPTAAPTGQWMTVAERDQYLKNLQNNDNQ